MRRLQAERVAELAEVGTRLAELRETNVQNGEQRRELQIGTVRCFMVYRSIEL